MNRERLLFVGVLVLIALWYFVLREPANIVGAVAPGSESVDVVPVRPVSSETVSWAVPEPHGVFTQVTNEREHERPVLPPVAARDLPGIWPPTSRSLRTSLLGRLRHNTVAPEEGEATIQLPALGDGANAGNGNGAGNAVGSEQARVDAWAALNQNQRGRIQRIRHQGKWVAEPRTLPEVAPPPMGSFGHLVALCQIDQNGAATAGVTEVEVRLSVGGGEIRYAFPGDINNLQVAVAGTNKPYWDGLVGYMRLPNAGAQPRVQFAERMIQAARSGGEAGDPRYEWALLALGEAREATSKSAQAQRKAILLLMIECASAMYRQELVLDLAFEYLQSFPDDEQIIILVGELFASRTFGLLELAEEWFAKSPRNPKAQSLRVGVLIRMEDFERAQEILDSGVVGSGADVDLMAARTALALGNLDRATSSATAHTAGPFATEANLILGGVAYARGDAAQAATYFQAAVDRDPRHSRAYSDLGLALAVQGKKADALLCFERAASLDFENTVTPALGRLYLEFAAADAARATEASIRRQMANRKNQAEFQEPLQAAQQGYTDALARASALVAGDDALEANNPLNLLVRFFAGYTLERQGRLEPAHEKYRSVIDNDHRYRIAIARLGVVLARHLEQNPKDPKAEEYAKAADAHLTKSQALNPDDPVVPYILARFHMIRGTRRAKADEMFAITAERPAPAGDVDLPLWAKAGRAALAYRDDDVDPNSVKSRFNDVQSTISDRVGLTGPPNLPQALEANALYVYCGECIAAISENQGKRVITYPFRTMPKEWKVNKTTRQNIVSTAQGARFTGTIDHAGKDPDPYETNSLFYGENREITRNTFYGMRTTGSIPDGLRAEFGVSVVLKRRAVRGGGSPYRGIEIKRNQSGKVALSVDGAQNHAGLKNLSAQGSWLNTELEWPAGPFEVRIEVEDRDKGTFRIWLKTGEREPVDVIAEALQVDEEKTRLLTRGGGSGPFQFYIWMGGRDGTDYRDTGVVVQEVSFVKGSN